MTKQRLKKGEGHKKILDAIENKGLTKLEIVKATGLNYTTVDEALKVLSPSKIELIDVKEIDGKKESRYISKISHNAVPPEYLKLLVENYQSKENEKHLLAISEINGLIRSKKKILDKDFVDFLIEGELNYLTKGDGINVFVRSFDDFINKLKEDIDSNPDNSEKEKELLNHIKQKTSCFFKDFILDNSKDLLYRTGALDTLRAVVPSEAYTVVFDLLKNMEFPEIDLREAFMGYPPPANYFSKNELEDFKFEIFEGHYNLRSIEITINSYFKINPVDCKRKLWEAYGVQKDERIKKTILILIEMARIDGHKINIEYEVFDAKDMFKDLYLSNEK